MLWLFMEYILLLLIFTSSRILSLPPRMAHWCFLEFSKLYSFIPLMSSILRLVVRFCALKKKKKKEKNKGDYIRGRIEVFNKFQRKDSHFKVNAN